MQLHRFNIGSVSCPATLNIEASGENNIEVSSYFLV